MSKEMILVTGGAGFIGSHTVGRLLERGHRVVVLDNLSTGKKENLSSFQEHFGSRLFFLEVDIIEGLWSALAPFTREHGAIDRIIHLSAQTSVIVSITNPIEDIRHNYTATMQLLEYAKSHRVKKVVIASSAAVYGDVDEGAVQESTVPRPLSPYGIHKLSSEAALAYYSDVHGVSTAALRFFNVYGPRQDPKSPYSGVISIFIDRALALQPITIFGDGLQTRDFVFVGDVARAIELACFSEQGGAMGPFNIGTGKSVTIQELAKEIVSGCGSSSSIGFGASRAGEILHSCANVERVREDLDFKAKVGLKEGLLQTIEWSKGEV